MNSWDFDEFSYSTYQRPSDRTEYEILQNKSTTREGWKGRGGNEEAMGENGHGAVVPPLAEVHRRIVEIVRSGTGSSDGRGGCDMAKLAPGYKKTYGEALDATKYARRV